MSELTAWLQVLATFLTLGVIIIFTVKSNRMQKYFIEREESFRMKPYLQFFGESIDANNLLSFRVSNIGMGYARDIKLEIATMDSWLNKNDSISICKGPENMPGNSKPDRFLTEISKEDIEQDSKRKIIILGTMKNISSGNLIKFKIIRNVAV